jgi:hypothetical protein
MGGFAPQTPRARFAGFYKPVRAFGTEVPKAFRNATFRSKAMVLR